MLNDQDRDTLEHYAPLLAREVERARPEIERMHRTLDVLSQRPQPHRPRPKPKNGIEAFEALFSKSS